MIVQVTVPNDTSDVRYGKLTMQPDDNFHVDVPEYVAKKLITLAGVTCQDDLSASYDALLAASERFETNYLFWSYGKLLPADTVISHAADDPPAADEIIEADWLAQASALLTARGTPSASLT